MKIKPPTMPSTVPMKDARNRFTELARAVEDGQRVTVTVHGRPVVDVVPHDPTAAAAATNRPPRQLPKRLALVGGLSLDELLDETRGDR